MRDDRLGTREEAADVKAAGDGQTREEVVAIWREDLVDAEAVKREEDAYAAEMRQAHRSNDPNYHRAYLSGAGWMANEHGWGW